MNEALRSIRNMLIAATIGAAIASAVIYSTAIVSGDKRFRDAQGTITELTDTNRKLQEDYSRATATAAELAERLGNRQAVINNIAGAVSSLSSGLDESSDLIQRIIDTVARIEYLLYN